MSPTTWSRTSLGAASVPREKGTFFNGLLGWLGCPTLLELMVFPDPNLLALKQSSPRDRSDKDVAECLKGLSPPIDDMYYLYDKQSQKLRQVDASFWNLEFGRAIACDTQAVLPDTFASELRRSASGYKGTLEDIGNGPLKGIVLDAYFAPSGDWTAVLTADSNGHFALPFFGGNSVSMSAEQHYHQFLLLRDRKWIPQRLRVPLKSSVGKERKRNRIYGCWSADEQFFVYFDSLSLCVLPFESE
ncbi:MAG: hypothetical protein HY287_17080 [Planctomycetes bacterium]|nr:hypothetical protein [Planctomycetota bacterium]